MLRWWAAVCAVSKGGYRRPQRSHMSVEMVGGGMCENHKPLGGGGETHMDTTLSDPSQALLGLIF